MRLSPKLSHMTLDDFQKDLRRSYVGGGPGAVVSGIVWALAAVMTARSGIAIGFATLFIGGIFIFPIGTFISRFIFKQSSLDPKNPGGRIVIETLPAMFVGLFIAYTFISINPEYVFPIAAMAVGSHYFSFRTAYGDILYWVLGAIMTAIGAAAILGYFTLPFSTVAGIASVEIVFGIILTVKALRETRA